MAGSTSRMRWSLSLLASPLLLWCIFLFIIPISLILVNSFGTKVLGSPGQVDLSDPSLDRYREALSGSFRSVLGQTITTSLTGTALCFAIGLPVAYFLAFKVNQRAKVAVLVLFMIPFFTNFLLRTLSWRIVLQPNGLISNFLQDDHWFTFGQVLRDTRLMILDTRSAVQISIVYNYLPMMVFPLWVALDRIDYHLLEVSQDLGAGRLRTFIQVTMPLAFPGIVAALVLVFVPLSGDYVTAKLLGGSKGNMLGASVAEQYFAAQNAASGSALAVVLILSILTILGFLGGAVWFVRHLLSVRRRVLVPIG